MLKLSFDYIAGLVEGEGSFSFCTVQRWKQTVDGRVVRIRVPAFQIKMHERDQDLIRLMRKSLGLNDTVYNYPPPSINKFSKPYKVGGSLMLIVRNTASLKNVIIPCLYFRLHGYKKVQFFEWLEKMGHEEISNDSQYLHRFYKKGGFEELSKKFV